MYIINFTSHQVGMAETRQCQKSSRASLRYSLTVAIDQKEVDLGGLTGLVAKQCLVYKISEGTLCTYLEVNQ